MLASIPSPPDNAISLGPLELRAYGLAIAAGVLAAVAIAQRRWARRGGDPADISAIAVWAVLAGLVGARAYHVITDWRRFEGRWLHAFAIWEGGLGIPGGLLAGVVVGVWVGRRRGLAGVELMDMAAPAIPVAQAIGRLGNWFNQELFGRPTDLPWALEIDPEHRPARYAAETTFHPTFLYEALWNLALAGLLVLYERRRPGGRPGRLFALYVAGYALGRLWVEALRADPASELFGVRVNIWTSLAAFLAAVAWLVLVGRHPAPEPATDEAEPEPEPDADAPEGTATTTGDQQPTARDTGDPEPDTDADADAADPEPAAAADASDADAADPGPAAAADAGDPGPAAAADAGQADADAHAGDLEPAAAADAGEAEVDADAGAGHPEPAAAAAGEAEVDADAGAGHPEPAAAAAGEAVDDAGAGAGDPEPAAATDADPGPAAAAVGEAGVDAGSERPAAAAGEAGVDADVNAGGPGPAAAAAGEAEVDTGPGAGDPQRAAAADDGEAELDKAAGGRELGADEPDAAADQGK